MNIKKYKFPLLAIAVLVTVLSCSEDYLDVEPKGTFLTDNYYSNQDEAFAGLVAAYDYVRKNSGGFENNVTFMNAGSDDFYAGGGNSSDGIGIQNISNYALNAIEMPASFWTDHFRGVYRANLMIQKLPEIPMDDALKARFMAESKALRGYYYFILVRMFENVPLFTEPVNPSEMFDVVQVTSDVTYAQIEADLLEAIPGLPGSLPSNEFGRLTKGAAQAILGKVYLEQGKGSLAAAQFAEVNGTPGATSQYGYKLLDNFDDLWVIDNKFNSESIFEISHTNESFAGWGNAYNDDAEGNMICTMVGPRGYVDLDINDNVPAYSSGWSFNPILPGLYDLMKNDPRFEATILDLKTLEEQGKVSYQKGYLNTGYFLNKYAPLVSEEHTGAGDMWLNHRQDSYAIRLADTYLLEAEALGGSGARAQALLDAVRSRVGLPSITVSMSAILAERRIELAGEGHRWFDLRRNGLLATNL
uniref:RagB/SusD family nutrient uptake outer membrane protein n=1 Tax=uncultured Lutibacter sp. TaxID=437739 RepID=UPI00262F8704